MKHKLKKRFMAFINRITMRLFGREAYPKVKFPIRANRNVTTTYPDGHPYSFDEITQNVSKQLTKKSEVYC